MGLSAEHFGAAQYPVDHNEERRLPAASLGQPLRLPTPQGRRFVALLTASLPWLMAGLAGVHGPSDVILGSWSHISLRIVAHQAIVSSLDIVRDARSGY
jgi:hypothetical protein